MERQYIYSHTGKGCLAGIGVFFAATLVAVAIGLLTQSWWLGGLLFVGVHLALISWAQRVDRRARQEHARQGPR